MTYRTVTLAAVAAFALCGEAAAAPEATLAAARVGAADPVKASAFYTAAFGFKERQRISRPEFSEVVMTKAGTAAGADLVIISRPADAAADATAHLILTTPGMAATLAAVTAAGGTVEREAKPNAAVAGHLVAIVKDPVGNRIELIEAP